VSQCRNLRREMPMSTSAEPVKYVNPLMVDDASRGLVDAARRLLEYERFHDRLEIMKTEKGSLPPAVEQRVGRSIQATVLEARALGQFLIDVLEECEDVGALEVLMSSSAEHVKERSAASLLKEGSPYLEDWLERRGMPRELWQWALQYTNWHGLTFHIEEGTIIINAGHRKVRVLTSSQADVLDPASFVTRAFGLPLRYHASVETETAASVGLLSIVRTAMRTVASFYE